MQINSSSQISPPFSYYDDEKFVLFCPSIELIFITHSQLIRQGRIVRLCLQINNTRTHNRQWQWSDHEIEDRSWFLYQVSAFPCVTAMGWAAHGPGWRGGLNILRGDLCVQDNTLAGSRVQVPNTGPYLDTGTPGERRRQHSRHPAQQKLRRNQLKTNIPDTNTDTCSSDRNHQENN